MYLLDFFVSRLDVLDILDEEVKKAAGAFETSLKESIKSPECLEKSLYSSVARKLKIFDDVNSKILKSCAENGIRLSRAKKKILKKQILNQNLEGLRQIVGDDVYAGIDVSVLLPTFADLKNKLKEELKSPLNYRTKKREPKLAQPLLSSIFSEFVFNSVDGKSAREFFLGFELTESGYLDYALEHVTRNEESPSCFVHVTEHNETIDSFCDVIAQAYDVLRNYGYLIFVHKSEKSDSISQSLWHRAEYTKLFCEKGIAVSIPYNFVRTKEALAETAEYTSESIEIENPLCHLGFSYQDTFYVRNEKLVGEHDYIIQVFELNRFDDTRVPCPSCHSENIEHNSFPKLGVRSWACGNLLCPDRSRTNRGARFSVYSLLRNSVLDESSNKISKILIKDWNRDVVFNKSLEDGYEMIQSFFCRSSDSILVSDSRLVSCFGKRRVKVIERDLSLSKTTKTNIENYRKRYFNSGISRVVKHSTFSVQEVGKSRVVNGDSFDYISTLKANSIDSAITSPPYYNARDYSSWENVYCYYSDMISVAQQVFRVLKPGGVFLYNIFDYFDNEKDIVSSSMGDKRLILASVMVDAFEKIGFNFSGNVVWDKGHIEGKRGFNSGNDFVYHQRPFNCWEHCLIFSKGETREEVLNRLPKILKQTAVIKIVKGENTLGHTAPFPLGVPDMITSLLSNEAHILDPYGGSGTTAISALSRGQYSTLVELDGSYADLALERITTASGQMVLGL